MGHAAWTSLSTVGDEMINGFESRGLLMGSPSTCIASSFYPKTNALYNSTDQISSTLSGLCVSSTPITTVTCATKPKRGRRSLLPPEQREQTRRLKKQNMERRRRACISDKMTALHNLAMEIIGIDPQTQLKIEKADILSTCHLVFEEVAEIARGDPAFQERLGKIRSQIPTSTHNTHPPVDENTQSSTFSDEGKENPSVLLDSGNSHRSVDHPLHELKSFECAIRPGHSTPRVFFRTRGNSLTFSDSGVYSLSPDQRDEKPAHSSSILTSTTGWSAMNHTRPTYLKTYREDVTFTVLAEAYGKE
ncbi:hypothetical protein AHF37_02454 [Paragonimus kellicotti]|nr:hypothetical protein AHF37_02454 [Paragonimus kellicotti]